MNHFSLNLPQSDTLWYTPSPMHPHPHPHNHYNSPLSFNHHIHQNDDVDSDNSSPSETASSHSHTHSDPTPRDHMFEKPLTPSDVGKLNRLVIPKQHAEKYFPLAGTTASAAVDGGVGGGGVLLGFEDEAGKCWRFRYSYWNSSQSYVLTKGWSRYVKEKKLDAGDVVLFERHRFEPDRFFIGWRRRGSPTAQPLRHQVNDWSAPGQRSSFRSNASVQVQVQQGYHGVHTQRIANPVSASSFPYLHHAGTEVRQPTSQKTARSSGTGNSKRLRLFGVNLECEMDDDDDTEPQTSDGSSLSSQGPGSGSGSGLGSYPSTGYNYFDYLGYPQHNHHNHMDINFTQDHVNQMRNRLG